MLEIVAQASNDMEAALIAGRLLEADIRCMQRGGGVSGAIEYGPQIYILVRAEDLERARATFHADDQGFDENELARMSEEASRKAREAVARERRSPQEHAKPAEQHRLRDTFRGFLGRKRDEHESPFGH